MHAMVYKKYGTPDMLALQDVPIPTPKDNEVQLQIHAASVNSWDWDKLVGKLTPGSKPSHPILGADMAGIVTAIGSKVSQFNLGDEVFGDNSGGNWGGFAQYACMPEKMLILKSAKMSFEQAAALPQAATLAFQALNDSGSIVAGQKILINGAGGGVGTFALQMAKASGAHVTCVDKAEKLEMLQKLGADEIIDYQKADFMDSGQTYDMVLDVVANHSISALKTALKPQGRYIIVGGDTWLIVKCLFLYPFIGRGKGKIVKLLWHRPNQTDLQTLKILFDTGVITPVIDTIYPLKDAAQAFAKIGAGRAQGKLIISIDH